MLIQPCPIMSVNGTVSVLCLIHLTVRSVPFTSCRRRGGGWEKAATASALII